MSEKNLEKKRVLVTGGTKGIGAELVAHLHNAGARVLAVSRRRPDSWDDAVNFLAADLTTASGCADVVTQALADFGSVDAIVHVMGGSANPRGSFSSFDDSAWERDFASNLYPAVRIDRGLLPAMIEQRSGVVVHVTSTQARYPLPGAMTYAASKAALTNYSKALANEVASQGIRVVRVAPGLVETEPAIAHITAMAKAKNVSYAAARNEICTMLGIALGRPIPPRDVSNLISFLLSDGASHITGSEFVIDGGMMSEI